MKITTKARALGNSEVPAIDSARVGPLSYRLAFELAAEIVESTGGHRSDDEVKLVNKAMPEVIFLINKAMLKRKKKEYLSS